MLVMIIITIIIIHIRFKISDVGHVLRRPRIFKWQYGITFGILAIYLEAITRI
jgi:hypothetical protein